MQQTRSQRPPSRAPFPQRLKLVHQLSLLLLGAVLVAMLGVGSVVAWNLRSGFSDYMRARDEAQLDRFMHVVERRAAADPSMAWLRGSREAMQRLMADFDRSEGFERPERPERPDRPARVARPDRPPPEGQGPADRPGNDAEPDGPPPPRPDKPPPGRGLAGRVVIVDMAGQWLAGREQPRGAPYLQRAVKVRGVEVALIRLTQEREPQGVDARFLQRQYGGLAVALGVTLLLSLGLAWWAARRWIRPLQELQHAARRMADGELGFQMSTLQPGQGSHEIVGLVDDVNRMSQALAKLESTRRVWIASISHELRTPLAVLRGEIESIEDGARQPTPEVMASLRDEVMQLTRLVNDMHTLSMAEMGELHCEFAPGDANGLIQRVAQRFEARAARGGLTLKRLAPDDETLPVCWDLGRIEQVLTNLLENSLRYTTSPGRVIVAWQRQGEHVVLTVEDSAPGVPLAQLPLLFEPLFRADAARGRRHQGHGATAKDGSGLGLSIAQAIVRTHRGSITASASALGGLAVQVRLPLRVAEGTS